MLSVTPQDSAGRQELFVVSFFSQSDASSRERFLEMLARFGFLAGPNVVLKA